VKNIISNNSENNNESNCEFVIMSNPDIPAMKYANPFSEFSILPVKAIKRTEARTTEANM
jgi:hypothetical protein